MTDQPVPNKKRKFARKRHIHPNRRKPAPSVAPVVTSTAPVQPMPPLNWNEEVLQRHRDEANERRFHQTAQWASEQRERARLRRLHRKDDGEEVLRKAIARSRNKQMMEKKIGKKKKKRKKCKKDNEY